MPVVTVKMWEGKTLEQKRAIVQGITEVFIREIKAQPENVTVIIHDMPKTNWGKGGKLAIDS